MGKPNDGQEVPVDRRADAADLERLFDDDDLGRVAEMAGQFNVFSALRLVRNEMRHSDFLAWLLNPAGSHGLHDYALRLFLRETAGIAARLGIPAPTRLEIDSLDLDDAVVLREWNNVDILIRCDAPDTLLVCAVENKVDSGEHDAQLQRYRGSVGRECPRHRGLFVYLTPEGDVPSDEFYAPVSYRETVLPIVERVLEVKDKQIADDVRVFLAHYAAMLRRYVMQDSDLERLCRQLYQRHRAALDLIFEYRPDRQSEVYGRLIEVLASDQDLVLVDSLKSYIRFLPRKLDFVPRVGTWTKKINHVLLFEFSNLYQKLDLALTIGPGDEAVRRRVYDVAKQHQGVFDKVDNRMLGPKWFKLYGRTVLSRKVYENQDLDSVSEALRAWLADFKANVLPRMETALGELRDPDGWTTSDRRE